MLTEQTKTANENSSTTSQKPHVTYGWKTRLRCSSYRNYKYSPDYQAIICTTTASSRIIVLCNNELIVETGVTVTYETNTHLHEFVSIVTIINANK